MQVVILAGGRGSRLGEETTVRPKPMAEIGGRPLLWHIMRHYQRAGLGDFVLCLGYMGAAIKDYFLNYRSRHADVVVDLASGAARYEENAGEPWRVTLAETGLDTQTGGRIGRVRKYLGGGTFCLTYGDAVTDLDIRRVIDFHRAHGKLATVTAVRPIGRFGTIEFGAGDAVASFQEKPPDADGWINGGFFVLEPAVLDLIGGDETIWEHEPLQQLVAAGELAAWRHDGFWHCMDTPRDKLELERLWQSGRPPWLAPATDGA